MKYGYARCSLSEEKGQDLNRQIRELKAAGAEKIRTLKCCWKSLGPGIPSYAVKYRA